MGQDRAQAGYVARAGTEAGSLIYQHIEAGLTPDRRADQMDELLELAKGHLAAVARKLKIIGADGQPLDGLRMGDFSFDYSDGAALTVKVSRRAALTALGPENLSSFKAFGKASDRACDLIGQRRLGFFRQLSLAMMDITVPEKNKNAALSRAYNGIGRIVQRALIDTVLEQAAVEPGALERFKLERERRRALSPTVEPDEGAGPSSAAPKR